MIHIQAIYEDGVLKPLEPLQLSEHQRVSLRVLPEATDVPANEEDKTAIVEAQCRDMEELDAKLAALPEDGSKNGESFFDAASRLGFIGCIHGTRPDLSTNKKYLEGLGKHDT